MRLLLLLLLSGCAAPQREVLDDAKLNREADTVIRNKAQVREILHERQSNLNLKP